MKPFWHPLSAVLLTDPPCFATARLVEALLKAKGEICVKYGGDRMWPSVKHGTTVLIETLGGASLCPGTAVLAWGDGFLDLFRVVRQEAEQVRLLADADPQKTVVLPRRQVLGRARLPRQTARRLRSQARRLLLDVREAYSGRPDPAEEPAQTVRHKYDVQAPFYAKTADMGLAPELLERMRQCIPLGGHILVVGSGAGRECFALAREGWRVTGVDFSPAMIAHASRKATDLGLSIDFRQVDIRHFSLPEKTLDGVLFTYDVYSFLPGIGERVRLLREIHRWLRVEGSVFLSARRLHSGYQRAILTLQWLVRRWQEPAEWGASHTRWIGPNGKLNRSFVRFFTEHGLRNEIASAGFHLVSWKDGHGHLSVGERLP